MYFPPIAVLSRIPGTEVCESTITIPRWVMEGFLRSIFSGEAFDAVWYRETHPDVATAIQDGTVADELTHFVRYGYYEGRRPRNFEVDSRWYEDTYVDVAQAIRAGGIPDAQKHFNDNGYGEPRAPTEAAAGTYGDILRAAAAAG
jgi:hypothetical protein